ncbi:hypothetical protein POM88_014442 [Heracleum sosnowskyi]|uniref:Peptidase M48 domain-containing protein n=1 Tax=Heracleum sosnowskyi TaxID=360622 RepID=A0AAD8N4B4_9APIA|nr:hypothetical protein POM88_014442 [Heracleum sosnowskyi]
MWYSRISKLATSSISKNSTCKNHPILNRNACFSGLVGLKSPSISSKYGYTNCTKNVLVVKHYHNSGVHKWYKNVLETPKRNFEYYQQNKFLLCSVLTGVVIVRVYVFFSEKIPYTNRTHLVFAPPYWDKMVGDSYFERVQLSTLSEEHPDSVRVKMIGEQIVEALESDLKAMQNQNVSVDHLVGFEWKFIVVHDPMISVYSVPGGKIILSTGFLKKFDSDAEIATAIAHEVGHAVARHLANRYNMWMLVSTTRAYFRLAASKLKTVDHNPHVVSKWFKILFQYPRWRRQESEADDIGLLVMASAGYDPQAAPKVYEIFRTSSPGTDFYDMHPSGKKRAKKLARGKVMKEASSIYWKVTETRKKNDLKDR